MNAASPRRLCALADLEAIGSCEAALDDANRLRAVVVRHAGEVRACVNRCAHLGLPLNLTGNRFFDESGSFLVCGMHGARFRPSDGYCVGGPCAGDSLEALRVSVRDGAVWLDGAPRAAP